MTDTLSYTANNGYIQLPVTTDPNTLQQNAIAAIAAALPGWIPREGHIEVLLLEQFAAMAAETAVVSAQVPLAIFSYFGSLIGINPIVGAFAQAETTWTMSSNLGYTVAAGTVVGYQVLGNSIQLFETVNPFTVASGDTTATNILIQAQAIGSVNNGLVPQTMALQNALNYVSSIVSTTISSGGEDAETTTQYLNRLSYELQTVSPRPILTNDYAILAATIPGVYRAAAFNNVNPFSNQLTTEDSTFVGGVGSWYAVAHAATPATGTGGHGEPVLTITATGGGGATVATNQNIYPMSPGETLLAYVTFDQATTAESWQIVVNFYDVNNSYISNFVSSNFIDSTAVLSTGWVVGTSPPGTAAVSVEIQFTSTSGTDIHKAAVVGLSQILVAPTNLVPDSSLQQVTTSLSWVMSGSFTLQPFKTAEMAFTYTGTGGASGSLNNIGSLFYLPAETDYLFSAYINASNVTGSNKPEAILKNAAGTAESTLQQTVGNAGTLTSTALNLAAGMYFVEFSSNNCTVSNDTPLTFAEPQVVASSSAVAYSQGPTWSPPNETTNQERMVTVAVVDVNGDALSTTIDNEVAAYLESLREINFVVNVIPPSYTGIDVTWESVAQGTANTAAVLAAQTLALQNYLSPALWAGGADQPPQWDPTQDTVRYLQIVGVLDEVPGLDYLSSVTIGYANGAQSTDDVELLGFAPLPTVGTLTGTVITV